MLWRIARAMIAFLFVALLVLIAAGYRKGAGQMDISTEIDATPQQIWPWLDNGARAKEWVTGLVEVRGDRSVTTPVGQKEIWVIRDENGQLMEVAGICTEYAPYSRLSVHLSTPGVFEGDQTYVLADAGEGRTRLNVMSRLRYSAWFARLLEPLLMPSANRRMASDITKLKSLVERHRESAQ
jgi:hypothetical protein